jgi:superfamily II DNA/RNA helicase
MPFSRLGLSDKVLAAVKAAGYPTPTPIQEQAIPHVLARRDVVGIAQTGTGKTAAFVLPMLTMLEHGRARARMPRTLIPDARAGRAGGRSLRQVRGQPQAQRRAPHWRRLVR